MRCALLALVALVALKGRWKLAVPLVWLFNLVGTADLLALLATWGGSGSCDFDDSGTITTADLLALLANWGDCG